MSARLLVCPSVRPPDHTATLYNTLDTRYKNNNNPQIIINALLKLETIGGTGEQNDIPANRHKRDRQAHSLDILMYKNK